MKLIIEGENLLQKRIQLIVELLREGTSQNIELKSRMCSFLEGAVKLKIQRINLIDKGGLINSIKSKPIKNGIAVISQGIKYARIHEYGSAGLPGGVIKPVKAKNLWIPLTKEAKLSSPRQDFRYLYFFRNKKGNLFAVDKRYNEPRFAYLLRKSVTIKEKRFMRDGIAASKIKLVQLLREYYTTNLENI